MEDVGDDFGDLYADVELQVSTAINGFSGFYIEKEDNSSKCVNLDPKNIDELIQDGEAKRASSAEASDEREVAVDDESDSEDDLRIVLNDDDNDSVFPVARGVHYNIGGCDDDDEVGDFEVVGEGEGSGKNQKWGDQSLLREGLEQSPKGHGSGERGNGAKGNYQSQYLQYKYIRPPSASSVSNSKTNGSAGMASYCSTSVRSDWDDNKCNRRLVQSGHNFSLPWYRTILDVNIDRFEWKPWRHPGADASDFFNFGFDEESWKQYLKHMEQLQGETSMSTRTSVGDFSQTKRESEAQAEYETGTHKDVLKKVPHIRQLGTVSPALQVEQREMKQFDLPKGRVIQVEDCILERQPSTDVRRSFNRDSDVVIQIALQDTMVNSSDSGKEESTHKEGSAGTSENGDFGIDDDRVIHQFGSDSGDELCRKIFQGNVKGSGISSLKRFSQLKATSDPVSVDSDLHGGQVSDADGHCHQNGTGASSGGNASAIDTLSHTKEKVCRDTCNEAVSLGETDFLLGEQTGHEQSSSCSGSYCEASGDSASASPERIQNHLRRQSSNSGIEFKESVASDYYHSNDSKDSPGRTKSRDRKYSSRNRSPIQHDTKYYRRRQSVSGLKSHQHYGDASSMPNTGGNYGDYCSAVGRRRQDRRLHGFDSYDGQDFSFYKESELSFNYDGKRLSYNQVHTSYSKKPIRHRQSFGGETDRYFSRRWDEGENFLERNIFTEDDELMRRDWHYYERGLTLNPLTCKESRRLVSNRSSYLDKDRVTKWRRKRDEFRLRKRIGVNYEDDFLQENYGYYDRERNYLDVKDERSFPSTWRGDKWSGRNERKGDSHFTDVDTLWAMSIEDDYWRCPDHQSPPSRSYRETHATNRRRGLDSVSPRNAHDIRSTERHVRHRKQISQRSSGSNLFGSKHDTGDTEGIVNHLDGQGRFGRRRHWQSEPFYWTEDEYISGHTDDKFVAEEATFFFRGNSRHNNLDAKRKLIDDGEEEHRRIKLMREGLRSNHVERSSNICNRGNHEKTSLRCRDSGDLHLVVGEGKQSLGRWSNAGNNNSEMADQADNPKVEKDQNNEKWLDKFPVTQHNEAMDIEEGQIVTEVYVDENLTSGDVAEISDEKKRSLNDENAAKGNRGNTVGERYDSPRILEMIAKMEKRQERFKEPITLKKETDGILKSQVDLVVETIETKQQRPSRKRRWGGN